MDPYFSGKQRVRDAEANAAWDEFRKLSDKEQHEKFEELIRKKNAAPDKLLSLSEHKIVRRYGILWKQRHKSRGRFMRSKLDKAEDRFGAKVFHGNSFNG